MFYGSSGTWNSMVTFVFRFDAREGHEVKWKQSSKYNIIFKACISCPVALGFLKMVFFERTTIKITNKSWSEGDIINISFSGIAQPKIKLLYCKFIHLFLVDRSICNISSGIRDKGKIWYCPGFYFQKRICSKIENVKSLDILCLEH